MNHSIQTKKISTLVLYSSYFSLTPAKKKIGEFWKPLKCENYVTAKKTGIQYPKDHFMPPNYSIYQFNDHEFYNILVRRFIYADDLCLATRQAIHFETIEKRLIDSLLLDWLLNTMSASHCHSILTQQGNKSVCISLKKTHTYEETQYCLKWQNPWKQQFSCIPEHHTRQTEPSPSS